MKRKLFALVLAVILMLGIGSAFASEIVITLGGDCVLGTREKWKKKKNTFDTLIKEKDYGWCFDAIAEPFLTDDISLINLEVVFQSNSKGHLRDKQYTFRGDPSYTQILTEAGIEQVNLANNHYIDFGKSGQQSTRESLEAGNILFSGYTYCYIHEQDGIKIGFAGCRETVWRTNKEPMKKDLETLKEAGCDVIIYSCHWGKEYSSKHNAKQEKMADYAIENGADIIVGTHPHCVQGIEQRGNGVVIYSLGNLVFGGTHDMKTFDAVMVQAVLSFGEARYEGVTLRLMPVLTSSDRPNNNFRPEFAQGEDYERIMKLIQKDSKMTITDEIWFENAV